MKGALLIINHAYLLFGATIYVGVLWALHFFWYPSWEVMNLSNVHDHFLLPIDKASEFFWVVVPLMFLANAVMIYTERRSRELWLALLAFACIGAASYVGQRLIFPVNDIIRAGVPTQEALTPLFKRWMHLNDVRMFLMTVMWLALVGYFVSKGNLLRTLSEPQHG
jgi:hypothetical protein